MAPLGSFVILSKEVFLMDPAVFVGGPWYHLASVRRSRPGQLSKDYVSFRDDGGKVFIEEIDERTQTFIKIASDAEWADIMRHLKEHGIFNISKGKDKLLAL
jgi:hypothetical protein